MSTIFDKRKITCVICLILLCGYVQAQITSTFNANAQGWTTPNDADGTISYSATGGNPTGFVFGSPFSINFGAGTVYIPFDFVAPATYAGNRSSYYNGTLRYDVQQSTTGAPNQYPEVTIANSLGVTLYYFPTTSHQPAAAPTWTTFSVVFNNALGFWKTANSATGPAATEAQVLNVLTSLTTLQIRGLYRNANVTSRLDNVTFTPPIIINTQPVAFSFVCAGTAISLTTTASGNPSITYQWQRLVLSVYTNLSNTGNFSGVTTNTLSINTTDGTATGNYRCAISGSNVVDAYTNNATVSVGTIPNAPTTTGASSCAAAAITLTASGLINGQYRWYANAVGGPVLVTTTTYTTPVLSATATYYVTIFDGSCESTRTPAIATINTTPAAPTTTGNNRCGAGTVALNAAGGSAGQYRWYTLATGGTAIAGQTIASYTTPSLTTTTNYYVAINNGSCESARTIVTATINPLPTAPTTTGNNRCGAGTVALNAAGGSAGQYRWYTLATGGTAIAGQTIASYTTPLLTTTTNYYVAINNGTCESIRTIVIATINTIPAEPTTTGDNRCGAGTVALNAAGGSAGQYRWYTLATGGTAIAGQTIASYTTPSLTTTTNYYVAINNGTCESTRTIVIATINTIPVAPTTTGSSLCGTGSVTLSASGAAAGQYRWYTASTGGTAIAGQTNSTYATPVLSITTTYHVSIDNGTCESTRTAVIGIVNTLPNPPTATGNSLCGPVSFTLTASGGTAGQFRWYTAATGGTAIAGETSSSYTTPTITSTTIYYASINDGICESSRAPVTATILTTGCNTIPPTISSSPLATVIEGTITLDLIPLITAPGVLDISSIKIKTQPSSGAFAEVVNGILTIDYKGKPFTGKESLTIEACDVGNLCTDQTFTIEVAGDIIVYNAISPNNDGKNDILNIKYIDAFSGKGNTVSIYNRWGSKVFETTKYNNTSIVFKGLNEDGNELPSGTYFYKISYDKGISTGYLELKR